jgi:hypothetical protein
MKLSLPRLRHLLDPLRQHRERRAGVELAALNFCKLEPNHKAVSSLIVD